MANPIVYVVQLINKYSQEAKKISKDTEAMESKIRSFSNSAKKLGATVNRRVSLPLAAIGVGMVKVSANFESAMNTVQAKTLTSAENMVKLKNTALDVSSATKFTGREVAEGMALMGMAGLDVETILKTIAPTADLAASANMNLGEAADISTNVMTAYRLSIEDLPSLIDKMALAGISANVTVSEMGQAFKFVAGTASNLKVPIEDALAGISLMGDAAIKSGMAGRNFKEMLKRLAGTNKEAAKSLYNLGISTRRVDGSLRPLTDIMNDLSKATLDVTDITAIFGDMGERSVNALLAGGIKLDHLVKILSNDFEGMAKNISDIEMQGLSGAALILKSALEKLSVALIDEEVLSFITRIANGIIKISNAISDAHPIVKKFIVSMIFLGAIAGPVIVGLGQIGLLLLALKGIGIGSIAASFIKLGSGAAAAAIGFIKLAIVFAGILMIISEIITTVTFLIKLFKDIFDLIVKIGFKIGGWALNKIFGGGAEILGEAELNAKINALPELSGFDFSQLSDQALLTGKSESTIDINVNQDGRVDSVESYSNGNLETNVNLGNNFSMVGG